MEESELSPKFAPFVGMVSHAAAGKSILVLSVILLTLPPSLGRHSGRHDIREYDLTHPGYPWIYVGRKGRGNES